MISENSSGSLIFPLVTTLLRRRWRLVLALTALGGGLAGAAAYVIPQRYTAKAQLLQQYGYRDGVAVKDEAAVDTLVELLLSPDQLHKLATHLSGMRAERGLDLPDYEGLQDHLSVYRESHSRVIAITFVSTNPQIATVVVNQAVKVYESDAGQRLQAEHSADLAAISDRLKMAQQDLDRADARLREFRVSYGAIQPNNADEIDARIGLLNQQLAMARAELATKETLLKSSASGSTALVRIAVADSELGIAGHSGGSDADGSGKALTPIQSRQLMRERDATKARIEDIRARLETMRGAAAAAREQQIRLRALEEDATAAKTVFQSLAQREADLVSLGVGNPPARLVTMAEPPTRPSSPNPLLFLLPAILGSALLGGTMALVLERNDRRLRSEMDVEAALKVRCVGLVPTRRGRRVRQTPGLLPDDPLDPYVEALRAVTLGANGHVRSEDLPRSFLFTGSQDGDGVTTLAVSFALYATRLNQKVLLMDLNSRRPGIAAALGTRRTGDGEAYSGPQTIGDRIRKIESLGIDFLPLPHRGDADPLAMLLSEEFSDLMARVVMNYNCIVIDSAPVASAAETRLLSSLVDRILYVVRWGRTDARVAQSALRMLSSQEGHAPIWAVVAQADMRRHRRYRYGEGGMVSADVLQPPA